MAEVDGAWACTVESPMGEQQFTLTVNRTGDRFTGAAEGGIGAMTIEDGEVDGDTLAWPMRITKPMSITLNCRATVEGDTLEGKVSAGIFGSFPIRGTRA